MKFLKFKICLCFVLLTSFLHAGSQSEGELHFKPEEILSFSKKVEKVLGENGARVAILGKVGRSRDQLPEGVFFTHTAFAVYSDIKTSDNKDLKGYAIYNLYQKSDDLSKSDLVIDYPVDFFADTEQLETGIIIPKPEVQQKLLELISSGKYKKLHNPNYSVIANPYTVDKQNCTEYTLDVLFAAIYDTDDINVIKEKEKEHFKAFKLDINPLKLMLGSIFVPEISTSDHPNDIETTTFETIGNYLVQENLLKGRFVFVF